MKLKIITVLSIFLISCSATGAGFIGRIRDFYSDFRNGETTVYDPSKHSDLSVRGSFHLEHDIPLQQRALAAYQKKQDQKAQIRIASEKRQRAQAERRHEKALAHQESLQDDRMKRVNESYRFQQDAAAAKGKETRAIAMERMLSSTGSSSDAFAVVQDARYAPAQACIQAESADVSLYDARHYQDFNNPELQAHDAVVELTRDLSQRHAQEKALEFARKEQLAQGRLIADTAYEADLERQWFGKAKFDALEAQNKRDVAELHAAWRQEDALAATVFAAPSPVQETVATPAIVGSLSTPIEPLEYTPDIHRTFAPTPELTTTAPLKTGTLDTLRSYVLNRNMMYAAAFVATCWVAKKIYAWFTMPPLLPISVRKKPSTTKRWFLKNITQQPKITKKEVSSRQQRMTTQAPAQAPKKKPKKVRYVVPALRTPVLRSSTHQVVAAKKYNKRARLLYAAQGVKHRDYPR